MRARFRHWHWAASQPPCAARPGPAHPARERCRDGAPCWLDAAGLRAACNRQEEALHACRQAESASAVTRAARKRSRSAASRRELPSEAPIFSHAATTRCKRSRPFGEWLVSAQYLSWRWQCEDRLQSCRQASTILSTCTSPALSTGWPEASVAAPALRSALDAAKAHAANTGARRGRAALLVLQTAWASLCCSEATSSVLSTSARCNSSRSSRSARRAVQWTDEHARRSTSSLQRTNASLQTACAHERLPLPLACSK